MRLCLDHADADRPVPFDCLRPADAFIASLFAAGRMSSGRGPAGLSRREGGRRAGPANVAIMAADPVEEAEWVAALLERGLQPHVYLYTGAVLSVLDRVALHCLVIDARLPHGGCAEIVETFRRNGLDTPAIVVCDRVAPIPDFSGVRGLECIRRPVSSARLVEIVARLIAV